MMPNKEMINRSEVRQSKFRYFLAAFLEKARQQWVSLFLMTFTLGIAVRCVEQSNWIAPQPSLLLVLVLGVFSSAALLKFRLPFAITVPLMALAGVLVTLWQLLGLLPPVEDVYENNSLLTGLQALGTNLDQTNTTVALIFLLFVWVTSCLST